MILNAFDILEVPQGSSIEVCKKAYKRLVKKYHPDINKETDATKKFILIQRAFDVITGKEKPYIPPPPPMHQTIVVHYTWTDTASTYTTTF